jgi:hypothetical protein
MRAGLLAKEFLSMPFDISQYGQKRTGMVWAQRRTECRFHVNKDFFCNFAIPLEPPASTIAVEPEERHAMQASLLAQSVAKPSANCPTRDEG